jgi:hypothetical protein
LVWCSNPPLPNESLIPSFTLYGFEGFIGLLYLEIVGLNAVEYG